MAEEAQWVTFESGDTDSDDALSLCDLPICKTDISDRKDEPPASLSKLEQPFEFRTVVSNRRSTGVMCAAEDVFSGGRILPLSISRSISSNSSGSSCEAPATLPHVSPCSFYAFPSPSPRIRSASWNGGRRRSAGSGTLLRIGVAMAPEMELGDIRLRQLMRGRSAKKADERGNAAWSLLSGGWLMGCKCSPEDSVSEMKLMKKKKKKKKQKEGTALQWLEELSVAGKQPLIS